MFSKFFTLVPWLSFKKAYICADQRSRIFEVANFFTFNFNENSYKLFSITQLGKPNVAVQLYL